MYGFATRENRRAAWRLTLACALALLWAGPLLAQSEQPRIASGQAWYDFGGGGSYLGVYLEDLSNAMRTALGLEEDAGILLERVTKDGPAAQAGLEAGDVLLRLGGKRTDSSSRLSRVLDGFDPEDEVEAVVWRKGKEKTFQVTLGQRRGYSFSYGDGVRVEVPQVSVAPRADLWPRYSRSGFCCGGEGLGVQTEDLTGQLAEFFQVQRGVLVTWVTRDSAAQKAGLKAGDVIIGVQEQPIQNKSELEQTLNELSRTEELQLQLMRRGKEKTVSLTP
jgi:serine protease Do